MAGGFFAAFFSAKATSLRMRAGCFIKYSCAAAASPPKPVMLAMSQRLVEVIHDIGVIVAGVHARALRDGGEIGEEVAAGSRLVLAVAHHVRGHGDLLLHHVRVREHGTIGIAFQHFINDALVRDLVAAFVGGDDAAHLRELRVARLLGQARRVPVGNFRRALLERRVHETEVRVVVRLGFMPLPMSFWIVVSTGFMFTLPVIHKYLFMRSP